MRGGFSPEEIEVLVADGGSSDRSREIVLAYAERLPNLRLLDNPGRFPAHAMNIGLREARGEYVVRIDAHSEYPEAYVRTCVEELKRTGADNVGGGWIIAPGGKGFWAKALALTVQHRLGVGNTAYRLGGSGEVDTVPFGAFRRELLQSIGGYREGLQVHEDFELNARIRHAGGRVYLSKRLHSTYRHPATLREFLRKAWRYGFWSATCWLNYPYTFSWKRLVPLLFVLSLLALVIGAAIWTPVGWALLALIGAYLAATCIASLQLVWRNGWRYLPVLPFLFFLRHLAYGCGTFVGVVRGTLGAPLSGPSGGTPAHE